MGKRLAGLIGFLGLAGCAAQDAQTLSWRAEESLKFAMAVKADAPSTREAGSRLDSGKAYLSNGQYDLAIRDFRDSLQFSNETLHPKAALAAIPEKEGLSKEVAPVTKKTEPLKLTPVPSPAPSAKRVLPAQALAKYLAGKRAASEKDVKKNPASPLGPTVLSAEVAKEIEERVPGKQTDNTSKSTSREPKVIVARAAPELKLPPKEVVETPKQPEPVAGVEPERPVDAAPPPVGVKLDSTTRKIPGFIGFALNEANPTEEARDTLDSLKKYLESTPHVILLLKPVLGKGEKEETITERIESVKSFFAEKGISDSQVQVALDRGHGEKPGFELFVKE